MPRLLSTQPAWLLRAGLHDAVVFAGGVHHLAAFANEQRTRLLDVYILPRRARHDGEQSMPMIWCRDDHGLDFPVFEQLSKIFVAFSASAAGRNALLEPGLIDITHGGQVGIHLLFEIVDVLSADQTVAD